MKFDAFKVASVWPRNYAGSSPACSGWWRHERFLRKVQLCASLLIFPLQKRAKPGGNERHQSDNDKDNRKLQWRPPEIGIAPWSNESGHDRRSCHARSVGEPNENVAMSRQNTKAARHNERAPESYK